MKSIEIIAPHQVAVIERKKPDLRDPHDVLIHVRYVGICGSDIHIYHGTNPFASYPRVFGHEFVGEVEAVGEAVTKLQAGDHVICEPIEYCGKCYACTHGSPNVCPDVHVYGVHIDGGGCEYIVLPEEKVFSVSREIPWKELVLSEPLTIGAQVCLRGEVRSEDSMLVMGAGPIGLCIMLMAKRAGAKVIMSDLLDERLAYAEKLGADFIFNAGREDTKEVIDRITRGYGVNVVADTVSTGASLELAAEIASPAGRVVEIGFDSVKASIPLKTFTQKQLRISGSRLQSYRFEVVRDVMNERSLPLSDFVDRVFSAEQAPEAFRYCDDHAGRFRKIVIEF